MANSRAPRKPAVPKWAVRDNNREARIQAACVQYVETVAPQVMVLSIPNGGPGRSLSRLVWMGMKPGATDLILIDEHTLAYMVEVKDADGVLSDKQKDFRDLCRKKRIPWYLVRSVTDMHDALEFFGIPTREVKQR